MYFSIAPENVTTAPVLRAPHGPQPPPFFER